IWYKMEIYIVQQGDTVFSIAEKFGVSAQRIISDNGLLTPQSITPGQALLILFPRIVHNVAAGENIPSIAAQYGISALELIRNNPYLANQPYIEAGQQLVIEYNVQKLGRISFSGFVYPFVNRAILRAALPYVTYLIIFGYGFDEDGNIITVNDDEVIALAEENQADVLLSLSLIDAEGQFVSSKLVPLLTDMAFQNRVISGMLEQITIKGARGMDIDMEYIPPEYRSEYAGLVANAASQLHAYGYILNIDLAPKTSADQPGTLYEAHDYRLLGESADMCFLMTYEWGYQFGPPMAIAPLPNVERVLNYALTEIPQEKIYLGMPNYAYDWPLPFVQGETSAQVIGNLTAAERASLFNVPIEFDSYSRSPFYGYNGFDSERVVWFEDVRSMQEKYELISETGIAGGGYWNLMRPFPQGYLLLNAMFDIEKN
ncbi:MAG: LysM peptidoglycan-binding domain-containing protein, partial [Oscillospiraceae bacterium]